MKFKRRISLRGYASFLGCKLAIENVYQANDRLIVVGSLTYPKGDAAYAMCQYIGDTVEIEYETTSLAILPIKYYVAGPKTLMFSKENDKVTYPVIPIEKNSLDSIILNDLPLSSLSP